MIDKTKLSAFSRRLVGFIGRHPWLCVLAAVLLTGGFVAGASRARADFTHKGFFWDDDPHLLQFEAFERRFGNDDAVVLAMHSPSGIFDLDSAGLLAEVTERMWQVPEVIRVDSLSNYNWVHAQGDDILVEPLLPETLTPAVLEARRKVALGHEVIPDYLVSRDAKTALILGRIKPGLEAPPDSPMITAAVHELVKSVSRTDHAFYVAGGPPLTHAFAEVATQDLGRLLPMAVGTAAIFLFILLRTFAGVFLPLLVVFMTVGATFGFAGWAQVTLTNMSTAVPTIMIAIGIGIGVHILVTYYQNRHGGLDRREAARLSLEKNLLPTFLTSATTAIGFLTFLTANLKPVSGLGLMASFGTLYAWLMSYLFLGGFLFILPLREGRKSHAGVTLAERLSHGYTAFLVRRRRSIMAISAAVAVTAVVLAVGNEVNSDPIKYFQEDVPARVANQFIDDHVGGARGVEFVIETGQDDGIKDPTFLRNVVALQSWIEAQPGVSRALSITDILKQTNRSLHGDDPAQYRVPDDRETIGQELFLYTMSLPQGMDLNDRMTIKNDAIRMTVLTDIATSRELLALVAEIEAKGRSLDLNLHSTGKFTLYQRINDYVVNAFVLSFGLTVLFIATIMVVFLRSFRLGLIAMIPNVLPILIGGAFLRLIGQALDIGTVIVAAVCLGIAVDDTIHLLANFRRHQREGVGEVESVRKVLGHTGGALVITTAVLVTSFATFATADFTPNLYFGVLTALILATALIADLTITPVLLMRKATAAAPEGTGAAGIAATG